MADDTILETRDLTKEFKGLRGGQPGQPEGEAAASMR